MHPVKFIALVAALSTSLTFSAHAALVADYTADWIAGTAQDQTRETRQADGWSYMWNQNSAIGTMSGYVPLKWSTASNSYNGGGGGTPRPDNAGYYVFASSGGGHPGRGAGETGAGGQDRYMIAAYTIQNNEQGDIFIVNSSAAQTSCGSNGLILNIYVNDTQIATLPVPAGGTVVNFNRSLGDLDVGDRVFVCMGPNAGDSCDGFALQFQLEVRPRAAAQVVTLPENSPPTNPSSRIITLSAIPPIGGLTYSIATPPTSGTLTPNGGASFTYTPTAYYNGSDSFAFTVTEGARTTAPAVVDITVTAVNGGVPIAVADTIFTPDATPVVIPVLSNDTAIDPPIQVQILTPPQHGVAIVNGDNTITYTPTPGYAGADSLVYSITDADNESATASVAIDVEVVGPAIVSPLTVQAIQGLQFSYTIQATGTKPISFTAAPLPAGLVLVGDTLQGFVNAGSYAVTISASNSASTDIKTLVISATSLAPNADTDGDGFNDELEIGVGSSPVSAASTPFTVLLNGAGATAPDSQNGVPRPFFLSSMTIKLNFKAPASQRDQISLRGSLPVPASFVSQIQAVAVDVGGAILRGVLDLRGNYSNTAKKTKIKVGKVRTTLSGGNAPFSINATGLFAGAFADEGLHNMTVAKNTKVAVFIIAGSEYFSSIVSMDYSARANVSGSAKSRRSK